MATYFKFKLQPGFEAAGSWGWGPRIIIPFDGGTLEISSQPKTLCFSFLKKGRETVYHFLANEIEGAVEPPLNYMDRVQMEKDEVAYNEFKSKWFNPEKVRAGLLIVNTRDLATYSVGDGRGQGLITVSKDAWSAHAVLPDLFPYLGLQMTLVNE